ncbi:ribonuclease H-like domain-containing protein [Tanacetum coccineum]
MITLAEFMIIAGANNRPPMLEKSLYDSWKSRMELYIENRENGRMILDLVLNGPLIWPTIVQEDGTTRKKTYAELLAIEKIQADCDLKATKIVLQGLPPDVYATVNHHKVAKEIWDRVKLLMQGTKLSLQEKECKLYDEFDKNQATIQDSRDTVQQIQERQGQSYVGIGYKGYATSFGGNNTGGQARVVKCYNFQGKGHMARQCTQPKRLRNAAWFKDKAMLAEAQEAGQILDENNLAFPCRPMQF